MQKMTQRIWTGVAVMLLAFFLGGCDLLGEDESDSSSPTVGSVDNVALENEASTEDFATLPSGNDLPADRTEALYMAGLGLGQIADHVEAASWEPTEASTFDLQPEELLNGELADPPSRVILEAILENETIGLLGVGAEANADVAISYNAEDLPTRITGTATGNLDAELTETINGTDADVYGGSMHAALDVAVDVIIDGWRTVDGEDLPSSVSVAYAVSLKLSSAMSVETDGEVDSPITTPCGGNLLISGDLSAAQSLSINQEMIDDPQLLADYLEEELQDPEFMMSIAMYDDSGSLDKTHEYDIDYFAQLAEEEQN